MNIILSFLLFFYPLFTIAQESENQGANPVTFFDLKSSLKGVLNNHKMIKATQNDIKAAKLRVKQAKGGFFPSLDTILTNKRKYVLTCKILDLATRNNRNELKRMRASKLIFTLFLSKNKSSLPLRRSNQSRVQEYEKING